MDQFIRKNKENIFVLFLFFVISVIVFFPSILGEPFWDDWIFIFVRQRYQFNSASPLVFFPGGEYAKAWPIFYSCLWFMVKLFHDKYFLYHLTSIALHALNSFLFYQLIKKVRLNYSLLLGLLYLVHPAHLYTVSWIIQIKTLLAIFFFLLCLHLLLWEKVKHHWAKIISAILFYFMSIFSKATTVGFIIPIFFSYRYFKNYIAKKTFLTLVILPIIILAAWATLSTAWNFKINNEIINSSDEKILYESEKAYLPNPAERVLTTTKVFSQYYLFNFLPFDGDQLYQDRVILRNSSLEFAMIFSTLFATLFLIRFLYLNHFFLFSTFLFYLATIIPFCGMIYIPIFDSSNFIPYWLSIPLLGLIPLLSLIKSKNILIGIILFWSGVTHFQTYNFVHAEKIFIKSIAKNPDSLSASVALIEHYIFTKKCDKAEESYQNFIQSTNFDLTKIKLKLKECRR